MDGLTANSDGLYRYADVDALFARAMAEYDAIEDLPTGVKPVVRPAGTLRTGAVYNMQGQKLDTPKRGVNIIGNEKMVVGR